MRRPTSSSCVRPSSAAIARFARRMWPVSPTSPMPIGASSNACWNTAWASFSAASDALRSVMSRRFATHPSTLGSCMRFVTITSNQRHVPSRVRGVPRRRRPNVRRGGPDRLAQRVEVAGVRQLDAVHAHRFRRGIAENRLEGRAHVPDVASEPSTMMMSDACCTSARKRCSLWRSSAATVSVSASRVEHLDREHETQRGEHRQAVHERLRDQRGCDSRGDRQLAEAEPDDAQHHGGNDPRVPEMRMHSTTPNTSPIASIGPHPMAYITAMIPNDCTATRRPQSPALVALGPQRVRSDVTKNVASSSTQSSQIGVDEISWRRPRARTPTRRPGA